MNTLAPIRFYTEKFRRRSLTVGLAVLTCLQISPVLNSATFVWDVNTSSAGAQDGNGTWANNAANWYDQTNNLQNQNWSNAGGHIAAFGAGANLDTTTRQINLSTPITAAGLVFRPLVANTSAAYNFSGSGITLATGAKISLEDDSSNTTTNGRINLGVALTGQDITIEKTGGTKLGLINLSATNSLSGTLYLRNTGAASGGLFVQVNTLGALSSGLTAVDIGVDTTLVLGPAGTYNTAFEIAGTGSSSRGAIRIEASSTLAGAITLKGNASITANTSAALVNLDSVIGETTGNSFALTLAHQNSGTNVFSLNRANTFTGGLNIDVAEVRINHAGALNSTTPNLVSFSPTAMNKSLNLNGFSVTVNGLSSSGGAGTMTVRNNGATAATLTIDRTTGGTGYAGVLADGTSVLSVVKNGAGAQALGGDNTFTGGLTLNAGQLNVNHAGALGATASTFTINGGGIGNTSGTSIVNSKNNAIVINGDFTAAPASALNLGNGNVSLGTTAGTVRQITVNGTSATPFTLVGSISNGTTATGITKLGDGTLVLGGSNSTYTGKTIVSAGILRIRSDKALGSTAEGTEIAGGARLQLENNITVTGESLRTSHLENLSGSNTWAGNIGGIQLAQLTLEVATGSSLLISGNVDASDPVGGAHTFNLRGGGTGEISGIVSNTLNVFKYDAGTWIFSGANSYTDVTNITGGNLQVGKNGVGQTGSGTVTVSNGAILSGTGLVRGATNINNGMVRAGDSGGTGVGTLRFTSSLAFNPVSSATVGEFTLQSGGIGDMLDVAGNVSLSANSRFSISFDPSYILNAGDSWNLLTWGGILSLNGFDVGVSRDGSADTLASLNLPDLTALAGYAGQMWEISSLNTSGPGTLTISITPEPSRALLVCIAFTGCLMRRKRQRQ